MRLVLYGENETQFASLGLGVLAEAVEDEVHEVLNGAFELSFRYPAAGLRAQQLQLGCHVTARPNALVSAQPFRIVRVNRRMPGWVLVTARHICYGLRGIIVNSLSLWGPNNMNTVKPPTVNDCPYSFSSDVTASGRDVPATYYRPVDLWEYMGSGSGMIRSLWDGEWEFDGFEARFLQRRGKDRGVRILYGRNLKDLEAETSEESRYNGIQYYCITGSLLTVNSTMMLSSYVEGQEKRLKLLDCSSADSPYDMAKKELEELETLEQRKNSIKVDFELLSRTEEYRNQDLPDGIALGDTVHIGHPGLGVWEAIRVVEIRYQPTTGKYKSITLGTPRGNILKTMRRRLT